MKDGSMFAGLNRYLEDEYLTEHPVITIVTPDGETRGYRIFAVKVTDTNDPAYSLTGKDRETVTGYLSEWHAPEEAERFLMLSTCTDYGGRNERLLIFAAEE
jgi:hypothetical protein